MGASPHTSLQGARGAHVGALALQVDGPRLLHVGAFVLGLLVAAHLVVVLVAHTTGHGSLLGVVELFRLDNEASVGTWTTSVALGTAAVFAAGCATVDRRGAMPRWRSWAALAAALLVLSVEEVADLHGRLGARLTERFALDGWLRHAWIVPGAVVALVFAAWQVRFVRSLQATTRRLLCAAAAVYVGAAIGLESLGGKLVSVDGHEGVGYGLLVGLEEGGELLGVLLGLCALWREVMARVAEVRVTVTAASR